MFTLTFYHIRFQLRKEKLIRTHRIPAPYIYYAINSRDFLITGRERRFYVFSQTTKTVFTIINDQTHL